MVLATEKTKLLPLADFSRLLARRTGVDMSGLMACSDEFVSLVPLRGRKIAVFSSEATRNGVISTTLTDMGAEVRSCFRNISSASAPEWKTLEEYWRGIERALDLGPDLMVDDCGDATFLIHEGAKAGEIYARTGQLPNPSLADTAELQIVLTIIREGLNSDPTRYREMKDRLVGVTVEATAGIDRLNQLQADGTLLFPAINVNHYFTKSTFSESTDFLYGLFNGIREATNRTLQVALAVLCGYEDASKGHAMVLEQAGAKVVVFEVDSKLAIQAILQGFSVVKSLDDCVSKADVLVISGHNMDNIAAVKLHLKKMKNGAIIFDKDSILLDRNNDTYAGHKQIYKVHSQAEKWVFPDTNSSIIVLRKKEYPSFMLSRSCTRPVLAMLEFWSKKETGKYERKVYGMPEHLEAKVSALHLAQLTAPATDKETNAHDGQYSLPIDDQGDVLAKTAEPKISRKTRMLLMTVQACSLLGIIALGLSKASKIKVELSLCAIWGN